MCIQCNTKRVVTLGLCVYAAHRSCAKVVISSLFSSVPGSLDSVETLSGELETGRGWNVWDERGYVFADLEIAKIPSRAATTG